MSLGTQIYNIGDLLDIFQSLHTAKDWEEANALLRAHLQHLGKSGLQDENPAKKYQPVTPEYLTRLEEEHNTNHTLKTTYRSKKSWLSLKSNSTRDHSASSTDFSSGSMTSVDSSEYSDDNPAEEVASVAESVKELVTISASMLHYEVEDLKHLLTSLVEELKNNHQRITSSVRFAIIERFVYQIAIRIAIKENYYNDDDSTKPALSIKEFEDKVNNLLEDFQVPTSIPFFRIEHFNVADIAILPIQNQRYYKRMLVEKVISSMQAKKRKDLNRPKWQRKIAKKTNFDYKFSFATFKKEYKKLTNTEFVLDDLLEYIAPSYVREEDNAQRNKVTELANLLNINCKDTFLALILTDISDNFYDHSKTNAASAFIEFKRQIRKILGDDFKLEPELKKMLPKSTMRLFRLIDITATIDRLLDKARRGEIQDCQVGGRFIFTSQQFSKEFWNITGERFTLDMLSNRVIPALQREHRPILKSIVDQIKGIDTATSESKQRSVHVSKALTFFKTKKIDNQAFPQEDNKLSFRDSLARLSKHYTLHKSRQLTQEQFNTDFQSVVAMLKSSGEQQNASRLLDTPMALMPHIEHDEYENEIFPIFDSYTREPRIYPKPVSSTLSTWIENLDSKIEKELFKIQKEHAKGVTRSRRPSKPALPNFDQVLRRLAEEENEYYGGIAVQSMSEFNARVQAQNKRRKKIRNMFAMHLSDIMSSNLDKYARAKQVLAEILEFCEIENVNAINEELLVKILNRLQPAELPMVVHTGDHDKVELYRQKLDIILNDFKEHNPAFDGELQNIDQLIDAQEQTPDEDWDLESEPTVALDIKRLSMASHRTRRSSGLGFTSDTKGMGLLFQTFTDIIGTSERSEFLAIMFRELQLLDISTLDEHEADYLADCVRAFVGYHQDLLQSSIDISIERAQIAKERQELWDAFDKIRCTDEVSEYLQKREDLTAQMRMLSNRYRNPTQSNSKIRQLKRQLSELEKNSNVIKYFELREKINSATDPVRRLSVTSTTSSTSTLSL